MGRHELPVDLAASIDDGPCGILRSGSARPIPCSTTPTTLWHRVFTGVLLYVWLPTYIFDDFTGSTSFVNLGTTAPTQSAASPPFTTAHYGLVTIARNLSQPSPPQEAPPPHNTAGGRSQVGGLRSTNLFFNQALKC